MIHSQAWPCNSKLTTSYRPCWLYSLADKRCLPQKPPQLAPETARQQAVLVRRCPRPDIAEKQAGLGCTKQHCLGAGHGAGEVSEPDLVSCCTLKLPAFP